MTPFLECSERRLDDVARVPPIDQLQYKRVGSLAERRVCGWLQVPDDRQTLKLLVRRARAAQSFEFVE